MGKNNQEGQLHVWGKTVLHQALQALALDHEVEFVTAQGQRRADIAVPLPHQTTALEWQCANISQQQVYERTRSYQAKEIKVQWLLGPTYAFKGNLSRRLQQYLNYRQDLGFYLVYLLPGSGKLQLIHHIAQLELRQKVVFTQDIYALPQGLKLLLQQTGRISSSKKGYQGLRLPQKYQVIQSRLTKRDKKLQDLQNRCYQQQHQLQNLPAVCFSQYHLPPIFQEVSCWVNCRLLLLLEQQSQWLYQDLLGHYQQLVRKKPPLVVQQPRWLKYCFDLFLKRLVSQHWLYQAADTFRINRSKLRAW
ncbi:competence protein CoiA family protein [Agrilactobacillus composti]|uniref:competence protein CoiA family protein n=1 Tax=Agrilactobacillus composti TaxID=398555 RepID=UPI0009DD2E8F|nr:competence protein CoiA family protein [Agrilactobacillus composti]